MPELIEVEQYRQALAPLVGHKVASILVRPDDYLRPRGTPPEVLAIVGGLTLLATRRIGKLLLLSLGHSDRTDMELGLRFGMTGRLLVDGSGPIDKLVYGAGGDDERWERVRITLGPPSASESNVVSVIDPRRLGSVELDPDVSRLGPDASTLSAAALDHALGTRQRPLKSTLMDQAIVAGLGNLLTDEILWRSQLAPTRPAGGLSVSERSLLNNTIRVVIAELAERGGSHTGDSFDLRDAVPCHLCDVTMAHTTVGGRSSWWCPGHQH